MEPPDTPAEDMPTEPEQKFQFNLLMLSSMVFAGGALMGINFWLFDYTEGMLTRQPGGATESIVKTARAFGIAFSLALLVLTGFLTQWYIWRSQKSPPSPSGSGV